MKNKENNTNQQLHKLINDISKLQDSEDFIAINKDIIRAALNYADTLISKLSRHILSNKIEINASALSYGGIHIHIWGHKDKKTKIDYECWIDNNGSIEILIYLNDKLLSVLPVIRKINNKIDI